MRRHLLRGALVERMHEDLCGALAAGCEDDLDGAAFFEYLRRRNLVVVEDDGEWLRITVTSVECLAASDAQEVER